MIIDIEKYLDEMFPNPKCELNYNKDYELLIAVVLSAQTTDQRVNSVTSILFKRYPTIRELSAAKLADIANIIKPIGTFNKKAVFVKEIATILVNNYNGKVPNDRESLESMPGVGRKTANVVLSNLFDIPAIAVDTHVSRVSKRLGLAKKNDDVATIEKKLMKKFDRKVWGRRHHQLVLFGRYHCKANNPKCNLCALNLKCKEYNNKKIKVLKLT